MKIRVLKRVDKENNDKDMKLKVRFEEPENGWITIKINYGKEQLYVCASFCPYDSFQDLVVALRKLLGTSMDCVVIWNEEPIEYEFKFSKIQQSITLTINKYLNSTRTIGNYDEIFVVKGTYQEICFPFWRALRDLQCRFTKQELDERWHRAFPFDEIDKLTSEINFFKHHPSV